MYKYRRLWVVWHVPWYMRACCNIFISIFEKIFFLKGEWTWRARPRYRWKIEGEPSGIREGGGGGGGGGGGSYCGLWDQRRRLRRSSSRLRRRLPAGRPPPTPSIFLNPMFTVFQSNNSAVTISIIPITFSSVQINEFVNEQLWY